MSGRPLIGVVGSGGAVGRSVVSSLAADGTAGLRLGGRRPERLRQQALAAGGAEAVVVDLDDPGSLARFCAGCSVVVNCAGPSFVVLDRVARAALAAGADYVDPGGDEPVMRLLDRAGLAAAGRRAVLTAGMMPGLSSLLPRWLATAGFDRVRGLTAYVGTLDHLTPASAADYLLSLASGTHGEAKAAWRDGGRASAALEPRPDVRLPFFPRRVTAFPYLSAETERLARSLALSEVSWFNVFDGTRMLAALGRLQGVPAGDAHRLDAAANALVHAAELDLFGREPYQLMLFQLDGEGAGGPRVRSIVVRATGTYGLTGAVAARAALETIAGRVPAGGHYAGEVLAVSDVPDIVRASPGLTLFEVVPGPLELDLAVEEGVL